MRLLEQQFEGRADQKAFRFRQLQRTDTAALYAKSLKSGIGEESYEVIRIVKYPAETRRFGDRVVELDDREAFPPPEQWGTSGWTYTTLEDAKKRFYNL